MLLCWTTHSAVAMWFAVAGDDSTCKAPVDVEADVDVVYVSLVVILQRPHVILQMR